MTLHDLIPVIERTWPPACTWREGPFVIKAADPGGNRVSAARLAAPGNAMITEADLDAAEVFMASQHRAPLFMVMDDQVGFDAVLEARGYVARDHTDAMVIVAADIAAVPPPVTAFSIWPPLAIQAEIWAAGGIDAARLAVMDRVRDCPRTSIFGRVDDRPAGTAYIGIDNGIAMLHALEIIPTARRKGLAVHMMAAAAQWASENGASWLAILVTRQNAAGQGLYGSLGMQPVGSYHYREKRGETAW